MLTYILTIAALAVVYLIAGLYIGHDYGKVKYSKWSNRWHRIASIYRIDFNILSDDHHRQAEHIEKLCQELEPFRPKISLDALYDAHAKGEITKLKTYKELEEEIKRLKEK